MDDPQSRPLPAELAWRQRGLVYLAGALVIVGVLVAGAMENWLAGGFLAIGIGLALLNSFLTELGLMRMAARGGDLSKRQFAMAAMLRLSGVSLLAFVLVIVFWPIGAMVLVGLAGFQLLSVGVTAFPLLKELRQQ